MAYIFNIKSEESEPRLSCYDPYCPTSFGEIEFCVANKVVHADLVDRYTDEVEVIGDKQVATIDLTPAARREFGNVIESLWGKTEAEEILPKWIENVINLDF